MVDFYDFQSKTTFRRGLRTGPASNSRASPALTQWLPSSKSSWKIHWDRRPRTYRSTSLVRTNRHHWQTIVLNFWSENCPPCVELHPLLGKLQEDYAGKGLIVLYLSAHDTESQRRYFSKHAAAGLKGVVADWQGLKKPYQIFAKLHDRHYPIDRETTLRRATILSERP